jgi:hypothetical protein
MSKKQIKFEDKRKVRNEKEFIIEKESQLKKLNSENIENKTIEVSEASNIEHNSIESKSKEEKNSNIELTNEIPMNAVEVKETSNKFKLSFIEDYEVEKAKKLIEEHLGFEAPRVTGPFMAVKIYVRSNELKSFIDPVTKEKKTFVLPDSSRVNDKFTNCVALVLSQGPECYKGKRFEENWAIRFLRIFFNRWMPAKTKMPWSRVGDWVVIPRHEGIQVNYRGIPMQYIYDDRVMGIVEDPEHVKRD